MPHLKSPASNDAKPCALYSVVCGAIRPRHRTQPLVNALAGLVLFAVSLTSPATGATTLYKCRLDGKTVFSDTDCPREVRIRKDAKSDSKPARPRVIKIRQKVAATRSR